MYKRLIYEDRINYCTKTLQELSKKAKNAAKIEDISALEVVLDNIKYWTKELEEQIDLYKGGF